MQTCPQFCSSRVSKPHSTRLGRAFSPREEMPVSTQAHTGWGCSPAPPSPESRGRAPRWLGPHVSRDPGRAERWDGAGRRDSAVAAAEAAPGAGRAGQGQGWRLGVWSVPLGDSGGVEFRGCRGEAGLFVPPRRRRWSRNSGASARGSGPGSSDPWAGRAGESLWGP